LPQLSDFLNRFRPAGAPGAATRAGVPVDRTAELSAEVAPVLAQLAAVAAEGERIVAAAERDSSAIMDDARERAALIAAEARTSARAARAQAAARVLTAAREDPGQVVTGLSRPAPTDAQLSELIQAALELVRAVPDTGRPGGGLPG